MSEPTGQRRAWFLAALIAAGLWIGGWEVLAESGRPHLAVRSRESRRSHVQEAFGWDGDEGSHASLAMTREFILDYPDALEAPFRVKLAYRMLAQEGSDIDSAVQAVREAAIQTLEHLSPGHEIKQGDFERAGFTFNAGTGWPAPFLMLDVDHDGNKDVLFAAPGGPHSICILLRKTGSGWRSSLFGVGQEVMGLQSFDITPLGPTAVVLASSVNGDYYRPRTEVDVFAWKGGAFRAILTGAVREGWQWDHKDLDGDGEQEMRLYGTPDDPYSTKVGKVVGIYRWNGEELVPFAGHDLPKVAVPAYKTAPLEAPGRTGPEDLSSDLSRIERVLFQSRSFERALEELQAFDDRVRVSPRAVETRNDLLKESAYHEAICLRKLGQTRAAELKLRALWNGATGSVWGAMAGDWLGLTTQ